MSVKTIQFTYKVFDSEATLGYKQITTFFADFSIAEHFGKQAIKDTYKQSFDSWKYNYRYLTELVMVLNWKIWEHFKTNNDLAELYRGLYEQARKYAKSNLKGAELDYFYKTTD